jgi:hypothetical protein
MKTLVGIVNFGRKNEFWLRQLVAGYQAMSIDVDIVVISSEPIDLGPDVDVRVQPPSGDPRYFPFVLRQLMHD